MRWLLLLLIIGCATGQAVGTGSEATGVDIYSVHCNTEDDPLCQPWIESLQLDYVLTGAEIVGFDVADISSTLFNYNTTTFGSQVGVFSTTDENLVPLTGENETNITICVQPNWINEEDITVTFTSEDGITYSENLLTGALTSLPATATVVRTTLGTGDEICTDGTDNDGDGYVDCDDPDCSSHSSCLSVSVGTAVVTGTTGGTTTGDLGSGLNNVEGGTTGGGGTITIPSGGDDGDSTVVTETEQPYNELCENFYWFVHDHNWGNGSYFVHVENPGDPTNMFYDLEFNVSVPENHCFDNLDNDADSLTDCQDTKCSGECDDAYSTSSVDLNLTLVNQTTTNFTIEVGVNTSIEFDHVNVSTEVVDNTTGILSSEFIDCVGYSGDSGMVNIIDYGAWCLADSVYSGDIGYNPLYNIIYNFTDTQHNVTFNQSTVSVHGYQLTVNVEEMVVVQENSCNIDVYGDVTGDGYVSGVDTNMVGRIVTSGGIGPYGSCGDSGESPCEINGYYVCDSGWNSELAASNGGVLDETSVC